MFFSCCLVRCCVVEYFCVRGGGDGGSGVGICISLINEDVKLIASVSIMCCEIFIWSNLAQSFLICVGVDFESRLYTTIVTCVNVFVESCKLRISVWLCCSVIGLLLHITSIHKLSLSSCGTAFWNRKLCVDDWIYERLWYLHPFIVNPIVLPFDGSFSWNISCGDGMNGCSIILIIVCNGGDSSLVHVLIQNMVIVLRLVVLLFTQIILQWHNSLLSWVVLVSNIKWRL